MSSHVSTAKEFGGPGKFMIGLAIVGLLIGLIVWKFSGPTPEEVAATAAARAEETETYETQEIEMLSGERRGIVLSEGLIIQLKIFPFHKVVWKDPEEGCVLIRTKGNRGYFRDCPGEDQDEPMGYDPQAPIPGDWIQFTTTEENSVKMWVEMVPR